MYQKHQRRIAKTLSVSSRHLTESDWSTILIPKLHGSTPPLTKLAAVEFSIAATTIWNSVLNQDELATHLGSMPWRSKTYTPSGKGIWKVPSMLIVEEKRMLAYLTENIFSGRGEILDLGCFLGGSTAFLSYGLSKNPSHGQFKVHSFDLFELSAFERTVFFPKRKLAVPEDGKIIDLYRQNIAAWLDSVQIHEGNLLDYQWTGDPIEILFVDLMKSKELYDHVIRQFLPHMIPGASVLILQDFLLRQAGAWHATLVECLKDKLIPVGHTHKNSALYMCVEPITASDIEKCTWKNVKEEDRIMHLARNASRWENAQHRDIILDILEHYLHNRDRHDGFGKIYNDMSRNA